MHAGDIWLAQRTWSSISESSGGGGLCHMLIQQIESLQIVQSSHDISSSSQYRYHEALLGELLSRAAAYKQGVRSEPQSLVPAYVSYVPSQLGQGHRWPAGDDAPQSTPLHAVACQNTALTKHDDRSMTSRDMAMSWMVRDVPVHTCRSRSGSVRAGKTFPSWVRHSDSSVLKHQQIV